MNPGTHPQPTNDRLRELFMDAIASGLDRDESAEHDRLAAAVEPAHLEAERFEAELAVAAAASAMLQAERTEDDAVPPGLLASLRRAAQTFTPEDTSAGAPTNHPRFAEHGSQPDQHATEPTPRASEQDEDAPIAGRLGVPAWAWGGWLAAAASLVVALVITNDQQPPAAPTAGDAAARLAAAPDTVSADLITIDQAGLAPEPHPLARDIAGRVRWADSADAGEIRLTGVEPNDPDQFQYQLWIFDATRRQGDFPGANGLLSQYPVDGGVFNVSGDGEVIIPVEAKLPVGKAALFAVTKEPPGGVVVSDREIVFVAALEN